MKARPARRIVLAPLRPLAEDEAVRASVALAEAPPPGSLRLGDLLRAGGADFLLVASDPVGLVRFDASTEAKLELAAARGAHLRDVVDLVVLLDHSYSMRARLEAARHGLARLLGSAADVVRHVALLAYAAEPTVVAPAAPLADARIDAYRGLTARGRGETVDALDAALAAARAMEAGNRRAVLLVTDGAGASPKEVAALVDAGQRASRLGVVLHVWDLGASPSPALASAARAAGGVAAAGPEGLRDVLVAMGAETGVPVAWPAPPEGGAGDVEFEIVVRALPPTSPFPHVPRKRRKP